MSKSLEIGMIGYNFMGKAHSNAWRQAARFFDLPATLDLHTICGRSPSAVEAAASQLGWRNHSTDWRAVVSNPEIDIIDICTPNDSHAEIAIEAAHHGKAILCEKPLALSVAQCREMLNAVTRAGVVHMLSLIHI
jgi:predicted dehydrogenase